MPPPDPLPILTPALVRNLEEAKVLCNRERIEGIAHADGSERRAEARRFGATSVFRTPERAMAYGFSDRDVEHLDAMLDWFAPHGAKPHFQTLPLDDTEQAMAALLERGFRPFGFMAVLYGLAAPRPLGPLPGVAVRDVGRAATETFADTYARGHADDLVRDPAQHRRDVVAQYTGERWRLCLAEVDGRPACIGALHVQGRIGYLANAATDGGSRRRGAHGAVLQWRIDRAAREGCALVASDTAAYSASQRNMERAGLRLAYQRVRWKQPG